MKETAYWVWQEPYLAALREQNPFSLPERLVTAEKAILLRMEDLRDAPENLPELEALRKALNSLYARTPNRTPAAPRIAEDRGEYGRDQWNGAILVGVAALIAMMSFATGWILSGKKSGDDLRSTRITSEPRGTIGSSDHRIASVPEVHIIDIPPSVPSTPRPESSGNTSLPNTPYDSRAAESKQSQGIGKRSSDVAVAKDENTSSNIERTRDAVEPSGKSTIANAPGQPAENLPSQPLGNVPLQPKEVGRAAAVLSGQPKAPLEDRRERQSNPPPSIEEPKPTQAQPTPAEALGKPPEAPQQIPPGSVNVSFSAYPSIRVPPELRAQAVGARLQIGQVISKIDPIYPEDARRQRIEGTVKLHANIGRDGFVQGIEGISGPPLLVPAALMAIRQWRYQPTLLGDQPIETGQDVTIVFRLSKDAASAN
jgi:TonB family protein